MSRSKQSQLSSSDSESDDDFYAKKPTESRSSSRLERPQSAISNTTDSKKSKSKKSVSSSDEDEPAKPLKSGSSTSIASKLKNAVKNTFRSSSSSSKKSSKKSDNKKQIKKCDTEEESSRSHSIERSIKNVLKSQNRIEKNEFSRPHTRFDNNSSASTTDRSLDTDRTEKNASVLKTSSDDDTVLPSSDKKTLKKIDSTNFKKEARSDSSDSSSSNSSSDNSTRSKGLKKKSSISKNSDNSGSDSDTEQETSIPIRVKFEKKPPIDKSKWKLEKPESGSEQSDTERSSTRIHQKARFLGKTFDLNSDSQSSGNEMTDVSPLQTPKNVSSNKLDMRVFYKALDQQNDNEFETYTSKSAKRNSSVKQNSGLNHNYDNDYAYTSHTNNSLDLDNFDYKMSPVSEKLMRNGPLENKRYYDKLVKQGNFKSPYTKVHKPFRVTSSALNRQREQQRIEKENQVNFYLKLRNVLET